MKVSPTVTGLGDSPCVDGSPQRRQAPSPLFRAALLAFACLAPLAAGPSGVVMNATTGVPEPRIPITLISFAQGMDPIEEVYTDAEGAFAFERELPPNSPGLIRAEHDAIAYSLVLPPGRPREGVEVTVYDAAPAPAVPPSGRILVLEPGEAETVVNESYLFENQTSPPITYRDPERGSLRFHLPPEAKGVVQVNASGPARMPLDAVAERTDEENVWMVDFPIKPGENRISLSYLVPREEGVTFVSRPMYKSLQTRVAVPAGVEISGEGLIDMGEEPTTQARIYEAPDGRVEIEIRGAGSLRREESPSGGGGAATSAGGGANEITVEPAPIAREMPWIIGLTVLILAIGFVNLYLSGDKRRAADQ